MVKSQAGEGNGDWKWEGCPRQDNISQGRGPKVKNSMAESSALGVKHYECVNMYSFSYVLDLRWRGQSFLLGFFANLVLGGGFFFF